jgi:hypothetical protein
MSRVKIEDLKPEAKELDAKDMKKLFGGAIANITSSQITAGMTKQEYIGIKLADVATPGGGGGGGAADQMPSPILINK